MKCPDCPQFTSKDTDVEPEVDVESDDDGRVTGHVRLINACSQCGTELEEANFDIDIETDLEHEKGCKGPKSVEANADCSRSDRTQNTDRHGRPIKSHRYMRRYYGYDLTVSVECGKCGAKGEGTQQDEVQASGMEWIA